MNIILIGVGAFIGLALGALISVPLGKLPAPYGDILPLAVTFIVTVASISLAMSRRSWLGSWLRPLLHRLSSRSEGLPTTGSVAKPILVDTSVIIDGRIADIARAGFVPGKLLVPRFVLAELQNIADSSDPMRRGRGRCGLEMLNAVRGTEGVEVEVIEDDAPDVQEVDAKLVRLARDLGTNILTTDYNLNRVAQIEGVRVLNVNELSNAIRPVVLPGEQMLVKVVQAGKEKHQGVGYLSDGTMIVVDQGDKLMGQEVLTEITRVFQTVAGKMLFAAPVDIPRHTRPDHPNGAAHHKRPAQPLAEPGAHSSGSAAAPNRRASPQRKHERPAPSHNRGPKTGLPQPTSRSQNARSSANQPPRGRSMQQQLEDSLIERTNPK